LNIFERDRVMLKVSSDASICFYLPLLPSDFMLRTSHLLKKSD